MEIFGFIICILLIVLAIIIAIGYAVSCCKDFHEMVYNKIYDKAIHDITRDSRYKRHFFSESNEAMFAIDAFVQMIHGVDTTDAYNDWIRDVADKNKEDEPEK